MNMQIVWNNSNRSMGIGADSTLIVMEIVAKVILFEFDSLEILSNHAANYFNIKLG